MLPIFHNIKCDLFIFYNQTVDYNRAMLENSAYQPSLSLYVPTHYGNYTVVLRATTQNGTGKGVATIFTTRSPEGRKFLLLYMAFTVQKMKFSIKNLFSKCEQCRKKLQICSYLLNKSLMENVTS